MALTTSKGYAFQMEIAVRARRLGYTIEEVRAFTVDEGMGRVGAAGWLRAAAGTAPGYTTEEVGAGVSACVWWVTWVRCGWTLLVGAGWWVGAGGCMLVATSLTQPTSPPALCAGCRSPSP